MFLRRRWTIWRQHILQVLILSATSSYRSSFSNQNIRKGINIEGYGIKKSIEIPEKERSIDFLHPIDTLDTAMDPRD
jgi:hypothetical protein